MRGYIVLAISLGILEPAHAQAPTEPVTHYAGCVRAQAVRLSPSGEPAAIVLSAAEIACSSERDALSKSLGATDPNYDAKMKAWDDFAVSFARLDIVETRAKLPLSVPPFK